MKIVALLLFCLASASSWACPQTDADAERRDRLFQRKLVAGYTNSADFIYIADIKRIDAERSEAELEIVEQFKGLPMTVQTAKYEDDLGEMGGCSGSFYFQSRHVFVGHRYVVYVKDGKILQASDIDRAKWFIGLRDEIRVIKKSVPNKCIKAACSSRSTGKSPRALPALYAWRWTTDR